MPRKKIITRAIARKAATVYLSTENASWDEVATIIHRDHEMPLLRGEAIRQVAYNLDFLPAHSCPYCKKSTAPKNNRTLCDDCKSKGRKAKVSGRFMTKKSMTDEDRQYISELSKSWTCIPIVGTKKSPS